MMLVRSFDAAAFNAICNDPQVYPDLAENHGPIDMTAVLSDERNVLLRNEHGGQVFLYAMPGLYEVHSACLPEGRGPQYTEFVESAIRWMFLNTEAWEIATRVPEGHKAAAALAMRVGGRMQFSTPNAVTWRGNVVSTHHYALRVEEWAARAHGLVEAGEWLHRRMGDEAKRLGVEHTPHENDNEAHNRFAGLALLMARGGQIVKGVTLYNRWATLARHRLIYMIGEPDAVRMDLGILRIKGDDIEITPAN